MAFDNNVPLAANQIAADLAAINANWEELMKSSHIYAADAEASDTYVVTLAPAPTAYANGMILNIKVNTANTGACTLNANALGAIAIKKYHDQDPETGDIEANQILTVVYNSTGPKFQIVSQLASSTGTGAAVRAVNPAFTTPDLGTPSAGDLKNCFPSNYFPDYNEADQGATGSGKSTKAYVDTIGADSATLVFRHNSGAAITTYTFSTDEIIPSNINVIIEEGAILSINNAVTLAINGSIKAGLYKVFSCTGTGVISGLKEVYPEWWGALGDGIGDVSGTDDYDSINRAITSCNRIIFQGKQYNYGTTITIADGRTGLNLIGDRTNTILYYIPVIGDGIVFAGKADNFTSENISLSGTGSNGRAIYSYATSIAPLRDFLAVNMSISRFLSGVHIEGGLNIVFRGGRQSGSGKGEVGGIGFYLGKDVNSAINQLTLEKNYVSGYETNIYNIYCSPLVLQSPILGSSVTALRLATGVTHAYDVYFDSNNDTAINKEAGAYLFWNGVFSSVGAQVISNADHRGHRSGYPIRVMGYRSGALSINGGPTTLGFDAAIENTEGFLNITLKSFVFIDADVSVANDTITEIGHGFVTSEPINLTTSGVLPAGLALATTYWVIKVDNDIIKLASSPFNAAAGTAVNITAAAGGGNHTLLDNAFTTPCAGYCNISTSIDFTATATDQIFVIGIYKNNTLVPGGEGAVHSSSANNFGRTVSVLMWLNIGDHISVKITTSANLAVRQAVLNIWSL